MAKEEKEQYNYRKDILERNDGMNQMTTLAEHREYLHDIVRLKLWFLHRFMTGHPDEPFRDALRDRVDIYRKTVFNPGLLNPTPEEIDFESAGWQALEEALESCFRSSGDDAARFEAEGFELLRDAVDGRAARDWIDVSFIAGYQCGSLQYEYGKLGKDTVEVHIANARRPGSMFEDPEYLACCFMELMRVTEAKFGCRRLRVYSWLNSMPKWLEYFPESFRDSREPADTDIRWHYGFWGQFITSRGLFNRRNAEMFRATGKMPFATRKSLCSFDAMRRHLNTAFSIDR